MLSVIRRLVHSKVGLFVTFALLLMIGLAFGLGDINGIRGGSAAQADTVATIGKETLTPSELTSISQNQLERVRERQPNVDMAQFVNGGGVDGILTQLIDAKAMAAFGATQGMVLSKRLVDGQIASVPAFQGPDGKFSQTVYQQFLAARQTTDAKVRADFSTDLFGQQLTTPIGTTTQYPAQAALPYASLSLERRQGALGFIPTKAMGDGAPATDAEVATWYQRNVARYTIPERRAVRYAMVTADQLKAQITPSEADLAAAYKAQAASFAPAEKRNLTQVIVVDQAAANALAAKVKAGAALDVAARAAGLEPTVLTKLDKAGYAAQSSAAAADAVFAAAKGALVGPVRSTIGFALVRVDEIAQIPGKSFAEAKPELLASATKTKTLEVLGRIHDAIDDSIGNNRATFDQIVTQQKLSPSVTPPLLSDGRDPNDPTKKAAPDFLPIVAAAFAAHPDDQPQMIQVDPTGGFAVVALGRIVPPGAPPVAQISDAVARDFQLDRARRAARTIAADIVAKAGKGQPIAALFAASGVKAPAVQPLDASRAQIQANPQGTPAPLALMFSMSAGTTKLLEAPRGEGWFVVQLSKIQPGNAAGNPALLANVQRELGGVVGREYVEQFANAVKGLVGVKKNDKAIAGVKAQLLGQTAAN